MADNCINDDVGIVFVENRSLMIPKTLKNYVIQKKICETQKCVVLQTNDPSTGRKLALKCISIQSYNLHPEEFRIMASLNHDKVIKAIESFFYPNQNPRFYVIVMPMATSDLREYINIQKFLPEKMVCYIMKQSLEAINYFHSLNIWHRDLKLDNIFLLSDTPKGPSIAIGDFGFAMTYEEEVFNGKACGTYEYAAPELLFINSRGNLQFQPNAQYSNKVDSWAMGVVMYSLFVGKLPFKIRSRQGIMELFEYKINFGPNENNPNDRINKFQGVSEAAKDLIESLLCPQSERLSISEALNHPWFTMFSLDETDAETNETFKEIDDDEINFA